MLFAELNAQGQFVRVRDLQPGTVIPRWVNGQKVGQAPDTTPAEGASKADIAALEASKTAWDAAPPVYRPLQVVETPIDPAAEKPNGFEYRLEADGTVSRISLVAPLSDEEKADYALQSAKATRTAALPDRDETVELILDILKIVVDRQLMTEVPGDPRTRVSISQEGYNRLRAIRTALKQTPLPNRIDVEKRTGRVTPDLKAESQRDVEINIFADRVGKIAADQSLPQAVKDAFMQLRKLLA